MLLWMWFRGSFIEVSDMCWNGVMGSRIEDVSDVCKKSDVGFMASCFSYALLHVLLICFMIW